jgi:hypothetical protein
MPQIARPVADISFGTWTHPVWEEIDEIQPTDTTFTTSGNVDGDTFEVDLTPMANPGSQADVNPLTLSVRLCATAGTNSRVTVTLLEAGVPIAYRVVPANQITTSFRTFSWTLTTTEVRGITQYDLLSLRVTAGFATALGCGPFGAVPQTWRTELSSVVPNTCLDCNKLNTIWDLQYQGTGANCLWNTPTPPVTNFCGSSAPVYMALYNSAGQMVLDVLFSITNPATVIARYSLPIINWNALNTNGMVLSTSTSHCAGWPQTLLVDPV